MSRMLTRLREEIGVLALISLVVLALSLAFHVYAVKPLEARSLRLDTELERASKRIDPQRPEFIRTATTADRLARFYRFFEREELTTDWLAKLYAFASAAGIELRTGEYRLADSGRRLVRYQATLPVSGSYAQIRDFVQTALEEVPVLSLEQVSFRRKGATDSRIDAEIVVTLHLPRK
jgi:hypothetical protein